MSRSDNIPSSMGYRHNYPDGSKQMPLPIEELAGFPETDDGPVVDQARTVLQNKLDEIKQINRGKYENLIQMGASPAPTAILMARLETLLEMVLDGDARIGFELGFEGRMHDLLNECIAEVRQRKLLDGTGGGNGHRGLIVPG